MARTSKKTNVNVTLAEAQAAANTYAESCIKKDKITATMNEKLNAIRQQYEPGITELNVEMEEPVEVLEAYAIAQRGNWDAKSIELSNCVIGFRTDPPSVSKKKGITWDAIVGLMKNNKLLKQFVKIKEDVDKAFILKEKSNPKISKGLELIGITIEQEERFFVDTKKDKVAV